MSGLDVVVNPGRCHKWAAAGFKSAIVPITPGAKGPTTLSDWRNHATTDADLAAWDASGMGVGIRARDFPAVDIDVLDVHAANRLLALACSTIGMSPPRIGRAPKVLVPYRLAPGAEPFPKLWLSFRLPGDAPDANPQKVEILADGQQWVADAIHPDTGAPYFWLGPSAADNGAASLATIDREAAERYLEMARDILVDEYGATDVRLNGQGQQGAATVARPAPDMATALRALWTIPNDGDRGPVDRDEWVRLCHAFKGALGDDAADPAAEACWVAWSEQFPGSMPGEAERVFGSAAPDRAGWPQLEREAMKYGWVEHFRALPPLDDEPDDWTSPADLANVTPPPRDWVVDGWLSAGHVTALFGPGGAGKSLLAQQLASCVGTGTDFLGCPVVKSGPVLAIYGEDDEAELHRRQNAMNNVLGLRLSDLADVRWDARAGRENAMVSVSRDGAMNEEGLLRRLRAAVARFRPRLVVVDNVAQVFPGNENDRGLVTAFVNKLTGIARDNDCAVLLLGHPAKAEGSEYSGSTAWDAAVRSRWYFGRPEDDKTAPGAAPDHRVLRRSKSNYSPAGEEITCRYDRGAFVPLYSPAASGGVSQARHDQQIFLDALDVLASQGRSVSPSSASPNRYAPKVMAAMPLVRGTSATPKRLEAAMGVLFAEGYLREGSEMSPGRHQRTTIEKTGLPFTALTPRADPALTPCADPAPTAPTPQE